MTWSSSHEGRRADFIGFATQDPFWVFLLGNALSPLQELHGMMQLWPGAWPGPAILQFAHQSFTFPQKDTGSVGGILSSVGPANWDDLGPKLQGDHLLQKQDTQKSKASFPKLHSQWKSSHGCPASGTA